MHQSVTETIATESPQDCSKLFLLKAHIPVPKFDIICLSETYLDIVPLNDEKLEISLYALVRSDHPPNTKHGGDCLYYKNYLLLRVPNTVYWKEYLNFEFKIDKKSLIMLSFVGCQVNSKSLKPSQRILKWLFLMAVIAYFSAKSKNWYS